MTATVPDLVTPTWDYAPAPEARTLANSGAPTSCAICQRSAFSP